MLKFLTVFASVFAIAHLSAIQPKDTRNWVEDKITDILNAIKLQIPDPWVIQDYERHEDLGLYVYTLGYKNISLNGTTGFEIQRVEFDLDKWVGHVELNFPEVAGAFRQYTDIQIAGIELSSDENRYARVTDFSLKYQFNLYNHTDNSQYIKKSRVTIGVGDIEYKLDGQAYGIPVGIILSKVITEFGARIINDNQLIISCALSQIVQFVIDFFLP